MKTLVLSALSAFVLALSAGCGKPAAESAAGSASASAAAPASGAGGGAPVSISTVRAQQRDVDITLEATGTVVALNSVDVRPQVASVITKVHIKEGQFVKAGQLLFTLDSRTEDVDIAKARAQLAKDAAALADAQRQLARSRELVAQGFISQSALDTNLTAVASQQASVTTARAAIDAAQVAASYSRITAPSAGRAGAIPVFAGSTVQPGTTVLVTITQIDPIAVSFNLPQRNLADALRLLRSDSGGKVSALLPEGRGELIGKLQFVDNQVDANSGTVRAKAQFDNTTESLWPGGFVNVRLAIRTLKDAVVVPQAAVIQGPRGSVVYTVDAENKAVSRSVDVLHAIGPDAVASGVRAGERIVVDGRQNLRPGASVVERTTSTGGTAGAGARGARRGDAAASGAAPAAAASGVAPGPAASGNGAAGVP